MNTEQVNSVYFCNTKGVFAQLKRLAYPILVTLFSYLHIFILWNVLLKHTYPCWHQPFIL